MKKTLSLLSMFWLLYTNTMTLISSGNIVNNKPHLPASNKENKLKVNSETNIDLEKKYFPNPVLIQQRGYKEILFNQYKTDTIKNLTNAFLNKIDNNLSINFKSDFNTFEQLQSYLNLEQQNYWQILFNKFCQQYQDNLKQLILLFYNFFANIWNKKNISEILRKLEIKKVIDGNQKTADFKNMSLIEQEFNEMVFKINPIMQKSYDLMIILGKER